MKTYQATNNPVMKFIAAALILFIGSMVTVNAQTFNMTNGTFSSCSGTFYDSNGPSLNYNNGENLTLTFNPSSPSDKVKVLFSSFSTEASWDALYIYDGPTTSDPLINSGNGGTVGGFPAGGWWGATLPGGASGITSTHATGALTFQFRSDLSVTLAGWVATLSCISPPINVNMSNTTITTCSANFYDTGGPAGGYAPFENLTLTFTPSIPSNKIKALFSSFSTEANWDALYIYDGPTTSDPLISSGNGGTIGGFPAGGWWGSTIPGGGTGITSTHSSGALTFVFRSDGSVQFSGWSALISCISPTPDNIFMTNGTTASCNGNFYDSGGPGGFYLNAENYTLTINPSSPSNRVQVTFSSFSTESNWDALYIYDGPNTSSPLISSGNGGTIGGFPAGGWWGSTLPGGGTGITSSHSTGALTFVFRSDFSVTNPGWIASVTCVPAPTGPPGDICTDAQTLICGTPVTASTVGYSNTGDGSPLCGTSGSPSRWYKFTAQFTTATASLCGSLYDTRISAYSGSCASLTCLADNDDFCGLSSQISFPTTPGFVYYLRVYGFASDAGQFTINVTCQVPGDACSGAVPISLTCPGPMFISGTTVGASVDADDSSPFCGNTAAPSVWYTFTGNGQNIQASMCGGAFFDTWLSAYSGATCGSKVCLASNDDFCGLQSQIQFPTIVGQTYFIRVHGFSTASGPFTMRIDCFTPPPNDVCSAVSPVTLTSGVPQVFTGNTTGATPDGGFYTLPTVWHAITLTAPSQLSVRLCGTSPPFLDAWIILANMCPSTFFTDIFANSWAQDCGDGNWSVYYNCLPAGTYYVPVLGSEPGFFNPGPYTLTVTATSTPVIGTVSIVPASGVTCGPTGVLTVSVSNFSGALQWQFESPVGSGIWFNIGGATFSPISLTATLGVGQEFASFGIRAVASVCGNQVISNVVTFQLNNPNQPTLPVGLTGCGSAVGSISATPNPLPNHDIRWYSAPVGGTLLGTGSSLAVNVTSSTPYYAATINNNTGCEGTAARLQVNVTVFPVPTVTAGSNSPVCAGSSINLTANGTVPITCGGTFTISVSGPGFGDETTWQFKDASNVVIASGGPYFTFGWSQTATVTSSNAPFTFTIETVGFFNDNTGSYLISCSGNNLVTGSIGGGQTNSVPNICCGAASETPTTNVNMGNNTVATCSSNFYDSGGPAGFYLNSENYTLTFNPSSPGASVRVVFNSFSTESNWDALYIYDGPSTASPLIASPNGNTIGGFGVGGWWGSTLPMGGAAITSTDPSGALTFRFRSDFSVTMQGWSATISCIGGPPPPSPYVWTGPNSYTVNAQNPSLTATPAAEGNYTVTFTTPSGCTAQATTFVEVHEAPVISTLQSATLNGGAVTVIPNPPSFLDIPVNTEVLTCDKVVNYNVGISGDPSPAVSYLFTGASTGSGSGTGSGSNFTRLIPTGRTNITVTATNSCGTQAKQFRVTVTDNVPPVVTPIQVPVTNTNGGDCSSLVQVTQPDLNNGGLFDNCPNASLIFVSRSDSRTQFEPYFAGTTTVTWLATDASSNTTLATQDVVVVNIKPVVTTFTSSAGNLIFVGQTTTFTTTFTDEDGGGPHTVKFYRDKNDGSPANVKTVSYACYNSCTGITTYTATSDPILYSNSEVAEPKVEILDGCNQAADQEPGISTIQYLAVAVAGQQFTTAGGHFDMPAGGFPSAYEGFNVSMGNVVKKATQGNSFKGQLEMNVHIPNAPDWRVHTDNGSNVDITWDYLTIGGCSLATFKGACRLNGATGYKVLVQQSDKDRNPATSNFIRVKVTTNSGALIFDTQPGLTEALTSGNGGAAAIITALTGGAIKVQPSNTQNQACTSRMDGSAAQEEVLHNMPNPFNGQTEIRFTVPEDGLYTLKVYNYLGQEVSTLFNEQAVSGVEYSVFFDGSNRETGIYTYTLTGANISETRKMNLVK